MVMAVSLFLVGCSGGGPVKKGERFQVTRDLRVTANTEWEQPYTDGFTTLIPTGTILEARFTTTPGASYFECVPIEVNRTDNQVDIVGYFVPEGIREREGFKGFSFSLPVEDIGKSLKKL